MTDGLLQCLSSSPTSHVVPSNISMAQTSSENSGMFSHTFNQAIEQRRSSASDTSLSASTAKAPAVVIWLPCTSLQIVLESSSEDDNAWRKFRSYLDCMVRSSQPLVYINIRQKQKLYLRPQETVHSTYTVGGNESTKWRRYSTKSLYLMFIVEHKTK